jgi:signal transduction histidine kinase
MPNQHDDGALDAEEELPYATLTMEGPLPPWDDVAGALMHRPRLSLRLQIFLGFMVIALIAVGIAVASIIAGRTVERSVRSLEIVNEFVVEIDNARRHEKNYFLYGTDLNEAIESAGAAREILQRSEQELVRVIGDEEWQNVLDAIVDYQQLLDTLLEFDQEGGATLDRTTMEAFEIRIRDQGHQMTAFARTVINQERSSLEAAIGRSSKIQITSLVLLLMLMIVTAYFIGGNIVRRIVRFESYAQRIAAGDFTPIVPERRYRDEFTDLGMTINLMMLELKKHEEMLVRTHKMRAIGTLTAGVAHEINNPLNNIMLTAHMLLEDYQALDDGERKEMIGEVVQEADRARKIVSNLLDFTRESDTTFEPLDMVRLVKETIGLAANQIKLHKLKAEFEARDGLPHILGDDQQLKQVFLNLILNAVEASDPGAKIRIVVKPGAEPGEVSVRVIDYGEGIMEEHLPRIFDPFFTTKQRHKGTGLGLSVSQGIVAKHDGRIEVRSREGSGTAFTVTLPAHPVHEDERAAVQQPLQEAAAP